MNRSIFKAHQLPIEQLRQLLHISQSHLLVEMIDKDDWERLLYGKKTKTIFSIYSSTKALKGKLSFYVDNNEIKIKVHPLKTDVDNSLQLDNKDIETLKSGRAITKIIQNAKHIIQLDLDINELMSIPFKHVRLPSKISSTTLSYSDKILIKNGYTVKKGNIAIKLNLNNISNLEISNNFKS